jgi:hypothetical protein
MVSPAPGADSPSISPGARLTSLLLITAAAAVFFFSASRALDKPFSLDETDIALRAHLILTEGPFPKGFISGRAEALTHPPLYEFVMAGLFKAAGETERAARGLGAIIFLTVCILACLTLRELSRNLTPWVRTVSITALAVTLLVNPLMIQHALLIDADTTGTALCIALFFYIFVRSRHSVGAAYLTSRLLLCLITAAMFLFKEMGPYAVMTGVSVHHLLNRSFKKFVVDLVLILGGGAALAWTLWSAYATALGMDPGRIFISQGSARYSSVISPAFLRKVLRSLPVIARWPTYWLSAPLLTFLTITLVARLITYLRTWKTETADALWIAGLAVWIPFFLFKPSIDMMKYQFPVYPILLIAAIYGAATAAAPAAGLAGLQNNTTPVFLSTFRGRVLAGLMMLTAVAIFVHYRGLGDYLLFLFQRADRPLWVSFVPRYHTPWITLAAAVLITSALIKKNRLAICLWSLLGIALPIQLALDWNQAKARYTTVESWMNYGEKGLKDSVDHLIRHGVRPLSIGCWRKDIQYYLERRHGIPASRVIYPDELYRTPETQLPELERFLRSGALEWIVTDPISLLKMSDARMARINAIIGRYYQISSVFGGFTIYRHRTQAPPQPTNL